MLQRSTSNRESSGLAMQREQTIATQLAVHMAGYASGAGDGDALGRIVATAIDEARKLRSRKQSMSSHSTGDGGGGGGGSKDYGNESSNGSETHQQREQAHEQRGTMLANTVPLEKDTDAKLGTDIIKDPTLAYDEHVAAAAAAGEAPMKPAEWMEQRRMSEEAFVLDKHRVMI